MVRYKELKRNRVIYGNWICSKISQWTCFQELKTN